MTYILVFPLKGIHDKFKEVLKADINIDYKNNASGSSPSSIVLATTGCEAGPVPRLLNACTTTAYVVYFPKP
jgi:hypothetical protein